MLEDVHKSYQTEELTIAPCAYTPDFFFNFIFFKVYVTSWMREDGNLQSWSLWNDTPFIFGFSLRGNVSSRESLQPSDHILGSACGGHVVITFSCAGGRTIRLPRWMSVARGLVTGAIRVDWVLWVRWSGRSCCLELEYPTEWARLDVRSVGIRSVGIWMLRICVWTDGPYGNLKVWILRLPSVDQSAAEMCLFF